MKKLEELGASPAPWEQDEESALPEVICHLQSGIRYQVAVPYIHSDEETDANTRLICAAPDLYDAAFKTEAVLEKLFTLDEFAALLKSGAADALIACRDELRSALAKASGECEV